MGHFNEHANQTSKVVGFNYPPERTVRCGAHIIFPFYRKFSVFDLFEGAQILVLRPDGSQRKAENVKNPIAFIAAADWSRLLRGKRQTRNIYKGSQVTLPPPKLFFPRTPSTARLLRGVRTPLTIFMALFHPPLYVLWILPCNERKTTRQFYTGSTSRKRARTC